MRADAKKIIISAVIALCALVLVLPCAADAAFDGFDLSEIEGYIPKEARASLPDGLFSNTDTLDKAFSFSYFASLIKDTLSRVAGDSLISLATLAGMVIVSSLFHMLAASSRGGELGSAFSSVSSLCVCVYVFGTLAALFDAVSGYLSLLASFVSAAAPSVALAYVVGGNITAASVSSTGLLVSITLIENMSAYVLYPLLSVCAVLSVASSLSPKLRIGTLTGFLRGVLMLLISLTVTAISAIMTFQHTLASAADTLGARAVKFAASSFIPIVGSAVSEAVRTVSGSISYIRSAAGGICIVVIVIITLPTFLTLMLTRVNLALGASLSDMLGCERETKAIKESGALVNFLTALVALTSVMFIYSLTLLIGCASSYV